MGTLTDVPTKEALKFCQQNHIQGRGQAKISYGLFYEYELVSVMTFSKPSLSKSGKDYDWELNRFCSIPNTVVVGGANRLFKRFCSEHKGKIISFCDLRWGTGNVYEKLGMTLDKTTRPNYYYIGSHTKYERKHRFNFTKQKLIKLFNGLPNKTEKEIAEDNGVYRIYDCGHLRYSYISE